MRPVRSALFLLFMAITVVPYGLACLLCAPLPRPLRYRFTIGWPRMALAAGRWLCGWRWQVRGWDNLPDGPAILLCKHQSTWETFFLVAHMPREVCFVFKRELLQIPFFGWGIGLLDMIHIDRSKRRDAFEQVASQGVRKLAEGRWIIIFPEGTRTPVGSQGRYKSGGARLAIATRAPVVPIAVDAGARWPKHGALRKRAGLITVSIGAPIPSEGRSPDELTAQVERWIEAEMRRIAPAQYATAEPAAQAAH